MLRNNNTQGYSPMHSYPGLIGSWDIFSPQTALRLLIQNNSAGAEVPRMFSFAFSWLRNLYKVSEMHILYIRWASSNQKGKLPSLYICCLVYKTAPPACLETLPSSEKTPLIQCPNSVLGRQQTFRFSSVRAESLKI